jgi:uncharacterized membrane protein (UPF0127 family)
MSFLKRLFIKLSLAVFFVLLLGLYGLAKVPYGTPGQVQANVVKLQEKDIKVSVARTPDEWVKGLSGIKDIPANEAKLFVFDRSGTHEMWMKDMEFPLDMAWLDSNGKVVQTDLNLQPAGDDEHPAVYSNNVPALYVVEMKAGAFEKYGIKEGEILSLDHLIDSGASI